MRTLSGVSFLQDAASELLYPILPIFLTTTLGAPVAVVRVVEGVAEGVAAVTKLLAGRLGDTRARRPLIAAGYGLAAVGKVLIALAVVWPVVLAGRAVDRVGKGIRGAPRDALLMVGAVPTARGRIFGFHRAADTAGAVVGPALGLGLGLYELLGHQIRPLLIIAVIPAVLSVLLIHAVHEDHRPTPDRHDPARPTPRRPARAPIARPTALPPRLRSLIATLGVFGLVNFPDALLLLRASQLGLSLGGVISAYILYNTVYALAAYPLGAVSDRVSGSPVRATLPTALGRSRPAGAVGPGLAAGSQPCCPVGPCGSAPFANNVLQPDDAEVEAGKLEGWAPVERHLLRCAARRRTVV